MNTSNPVLKDRAFALPYGDDDVMTAGGTANKTLLLLAICLATASWAWNRPQLAPTILLWGLGGFAVALLTVFKKSMAPFTAPAYAAIQGVVIGFISMMMEGHFPGIVYQAVGLTFGTLGVLLVAYQARWIRVTETFRSAVFAATGAIMLVYLVSFVMSFFGKSIPMIHEGGTVGIIFSIVVVGIASMNLVLDFDFIERSAQHGAPKFMEWFGAFGLMVTLIWLYIEILRLLSKIRSRR